MQISLQNEEVNLILDLVNGQPTCVKAHVFKSLNDAIVDAKNKEIQFSRCNHKIRKYTGIADKCTICGMTEHFSWTLMTHCPECFKDDGLMIELVGGVCPQCHTKF